MPAQGRRATHLITLAADDGAMLYLGLWKDLLVGLRCFPNPLMDLETTTELTNWVKYAKISRWLSRALGKVSGLPCHILRQWHFVSCATKTAPQTCAWEDKEWQRRSKNLMTCLAWWM